MAKLSHRWLSPGRALIGLALLMSVVLVGTSAGIHLSVRRAFGDLIRSEALSLLGSVRDRVRLADHDVTADDLTLLLEELHDRGLRYVALGDGVLAVGESLVAPAGDPRRRLTITIAGERVRVTARRLRHRWRPRRRPGATVRRLLRSITLELEPTAALHMRAQARGALWISAIIALVMIGLALLAARWTGRQRELEQQLEDKRRLAALGQMSAVLAHELRNPLASLKGHAQLLEEMLGAEQDRATRKVGQVVHEAERLEALTNELLEFVRTGAIDVQPSVPLELVQQVAREHGDRVVIEEREAPEHWGYDAARLRRVLVNLIDNALQASPPDSAVTVRVAQDQGALVIAVHDRGSGIVAGDEEAIFEPFHTGRTRGTGLGLAVARRIVEAHGGTLTASNVDQGGACFTIALPPAEEAAMRRGA